MLDEQEVRGVIIPRDNMVLHNFSQLVNIVDNGTEVADWNLGEGRISGN